MTRVLGVDGCRGGWAVVEVEAAGPLCPVARFEPDMRAAIASGATIAIDMPLGLPERIEGPGRVAEQAVKRMLGPRQSSVFSMPSRAAIMEDTWEGACRVALATSDPPRKTSRQAFHLFPMIRALDALLTPDNQHTVFECHAEVAFWRLNGEAPMPTAKRVKGVPAAEGLAERIALLVRHGYDAAFFECRPRGVPLIDLVDAAAIALIARRCAAGEARPFPDPPGRDARGLRVAIWA
ncbi:DUF429 domain-containing protein [Acuticoccus sp. M5D2P5]|uniref:DUF429 domain-containing protein n=1 Tax=Acuticoccus kalidii TaxID=2910977 RepID=UPI001F39ACC0|nr:DUF429 domain-containing protein [Acuticoccus kalidii]MCF3933800.1 DUF429 domain-containing protein [Acuticoccus kalidii]